MADGYSKPKNQFPLASQVLLRIPLLLLVASVPFLPFSSAAAQSRDRFEEQRNRMVDKEIAGEGIKNAAVLRAMRTVPRHEFVSSKWQPLAYYDQALPIGYKQTISPPFIVAYMTEVLDPKPEDKVLEIGTGSGYQAAVLSEIVKDVYTIEVVPELGKNAAKVLKKYRNVHTKIGDGYKGWPDAEPFDKIIVTCSPESVPQPLIDQLKDGGRMIIPLGERYEQRFFLFEKKDGKLEKKGLLSALFVPMTQQAESERKVKPDPAHPEIHNGNFEKLDDEGRPDGWHYQRQVTVEMGNAPEGKHFITLSNKEPGRVALILKGLALDGRKVKSAEISFWVRGKDIKPAGNAEGPSLILQYFDDNRQPIQELEMIPREGATPWEGTFDWKKATLRIFPPKNAREAIVRISLYGATGELSVDDVRLVPQPK